MKQPEQRLHLIMDESDAPYRDDEYTRTLADDLMLIHFAKQHGLEFRPDSYLGKLSQSMDDSRNKG